MAGESFEQIDKQVNETETTRTFTQTMTQTQTDVQQTDESDLSKQVNTQLQVAVQGYLNTKLRNVATINDRGEMVAVAFFPDGNHRPVLLVPCDENDPESCLDSSSLSAMPSINATVAGRREAPDSTVCGSL